MSKFKQAIAITMVMMMTVVFIPTSAFGTAEPAANDQQTQVTEPAEQETPASEEKAPASEEKASKSEKETSSDKKEESTQKDQKEAADKSAEESGTTKEAPKSAPTKMQANGTVSAQDSNAPTANDLTYTGEAQMLIGNYKNSGSIMVKEGFIRYYYRVDGGAWKSDDTKHGTDVKEGIVGTEAKTYKVEYYTSTCTEASLSMSGTKYTWSDSAVSSINVTIKKATPTVTVTGASNLSYNNSDQNLISSASTDFGQLQYKVDGGSWSTSIPKGKEEKEYNIEWKVAGSNNWNEKSGSLKVEITKTRATATVTGNTNLTFNDSDQKLIKSASCVGGTLKYSLDNSTWTDNKESVTGKNAGDYTVYYKVDPDDTHASTSGTIKVNIAKAQLPANAVTKAEGLVYNGEQQNLAVENLPKGCNAYYKTGYVVGKDTSESDAIPTEKDVVTNVLYDSYYVYYRVDGGQNYNNKDYDTGNLGVWKLDFKVAIDPAPLKSIEFNETLPLKYNSAEQSVSIKKVMAGKDGDLVECPSGSYSVASGSKTSGTVVGEYTAKVEAKSSESNFTGSCEGKWKIDKSYSFTNGALKIKGSDGTFAVESKGYEFTGVDITPDIQVEADGEKLTKGTDYEVIAAESTTKAKAVGEYTIKVKGIGDYSNAANVAEAHWSIKNPQLKDAEISFSSKTYNKENQMPTVTKVTDTKGNVVNSSAYTVTYKNASGEAVTESKNAGNYSVVITAKEGSNYDGSVTKSYEITKADIPSDCLPKAKGGLRYNEKKQALVDESKLPEGTNAKYKAAIKLADLFNLKETDTVPEAMGPASTFPYLVVYKIDGGTNYKDVAYNYTKYLEIYINKALLKKIEFNESTPFTYDGKQKEVTVKLLAGKEGDTFEVPTEYYNVTGDTTGTKPGEYTVTIEKNASSDYSSYFEDPPADLAATWKINRTFKFSDGDLTISDKAGGTYTKDGTSYEYDGKTKTPVFKLEADGEELAKDTYYEIVNEGTTLSASKAGDYAIKVKGINGYEGNTATATWKIEPLDIEAADLDSSYYNEESQTYSKMYTGSVLKPEVTSVTDEKGNTVPEEDYEVSYYVKGTGGAKDTLIENPTDAGDYRVKIEGKGNHSGFVWVDYSITKSDYLVENASTLITGKTGLKYNGEDQELVDVAKELSDKKFDGIKIKYKTAAQGTETAEIPTGKDAYADGTQIEYPVWFKIEGGNNYEDVDFPAEDPNFIVKIARSDIEAAKLDSSYYNAESQKYSKMYDESIFKPDVESVTDDNDKAVPKEDYEVSYYAKGTGDEEDTLIEEPIDAGDYRVKIEGKGNHSGVVWVDYSITKSDYLVKNASTLITGKTGLKYNGKDQELVNVDAGLSAKKFEDITIKYKTEAQGTESEEIPTGKDAYTDEEAQIEYNVWFEIEGGNNYKDVDFPTGNPNFTVKIDKETPTVTVMPETGMTYNGSPQALVKSATAKFGDVDADLSEVKIKLNYRASGEEEWLLDNWVDSENYSDVAATDAGTYQIGYKIEGSKNWNEVVSDGETLAFAETEIDKRSILDDDVELETVCDEITYDGKDHGPGVEGDTIDFTVKYKGEELDRGTDYTISGDLSKKNANASSGEEGSKYTTCITGKGNFTGTSEGEGETAIEKQFTWKINKLVLDDKDEDVTIEIEPEINFDNVFDGEFHAPKVTLKYKDQTITAEDQYSIAFRKISGPNTETKLKTMSVDSEDEAKDEAKEGLLTKIKDAGTYEVIIESKNTDNIVGNKCFKTLYTMEQKPVTITWNHTTLFTFDGKQHAPQARISGVLDEDKGSCVLDISPKETNANPTDKPYVAKASQSETWNDNYVLSGTEKELSKEYNVATRDIATLLPVLTPETIVHTGKTVGPKITVVVDGKELVEGTDYIVSGTRKAKKVGTYSVKVEGIGNYTGKTEAATWEIVSATEDGETTGDHANIGIALGMMIVSIIAGLLVVFRRRREQ